MTCLFSPEEVAVVTRKRRSLIGDDVKSAIADAVAQVEDRFGEGAAYDGQKNPFLEVAGWVGTGSTLLDMAISGIPGVGGIPLGKIVEIFGPESNGKSTLAYNLLAMTQKAGGVAVLIDTEFSFKASWAKLYGLDPEGVLFLYPETLEELFNMIGGAESGVEEEELEEGDEKFKKKSGKKKPKPEYRSEGTIHTVRKSIPNAPLVIVWDSVAATTSDEEDAKGYHQHVIASHARVMSKAFRKIVKLFARERVAFVMLNQVRSKIDVQFGSKFETFGGWAPKFYSALRLELKRISTLKRGEEIVGIRTRVRSIKNKVGAPFKVVEFPIMFDRGIYDEASWFGFLKTNKLIKVKESWAWLEVDGEQIGPKFQGELGFASKLEKNSHMAEVAHKLVLGLPLKLDVVEGEKEEVDAGEAESKN